MGKFIKSKANGHNHIKRFVESLQEHWVTQRAARPGACWVSTVVLLATALPTVPGSPGLVDMGEDSCTEVCGLKSQHHLMYGHFFHIFVVKIVMFVWRDENKLKSGRGWYTWINSAIVRLPNQGAAIAQWICLCLPSCCPGFTSQACLLRFFHL